MDMNPNFINSKINEIEKDLQSMEREIEKIYAKEDESVKRIINLEHTISGVNGSEGLQKDVKEIKNDHKETRQQLDNINKTLTYYRGMAIALQLLGAALTTLLGLLANFILK